MDLKRLSLKTLVITEKAESLKVQNPLKKTQISKRANFRKNWYIPSASKTNPISVKNESSEI